MHFFTSERNRGSDRELMVAIVAGDNVGFSDTVEYEAVTTRDGVIVLSWQEHSSRRARWWKSCRSVFNLGKDSVANCDEMSEVRLLEANCPPAALNVGFGDPHLAA